MTLIQNLLDWTRWKILLKMSDISCFWKTIHKNSLKIRKHDLKFKIFDSYNSFFSYSHSLTFAILFFCNNVSTFWHQMNEGFKIWIPSWQKSQKLLRIPYIILQHYIYSTYLHTHINCQHYFNILTTVTKNKCRHKWWQNM